MTEDEAKLLRRQYFGLLCAASCESSSGCDLTSHDKEWAWTRAAAMVDEVIARETAEAAAERIRAAKGPLR